MTENIRVIFIKNCDDCPYKDLSGNNPFCYYDMFSLEGHDLLKIHPDCKIEEIEIDLDENA